MEAVFQSADLAQIRARGGELHKIERQLEILRQPPPPIHLQRPCVIEDGIKKIDSDMQALEEEWRGAARSLMQFVPASGAATRMFSFLRLSSTSGSLALEDLRRQSDTGDHNARKTLRLLENLELLPFSHQLESVAREHTGAGLKELRRRDPALLLQLIVDQPGLGLRTLPKGLLPFHRYVTGPRTAFEEHLYAAAGYLSDGSSPARFHFTVAGEHHDSFRRLTASASLGIGEALGIDLDIGFSLQNPVTDTIACDLDGNPLRDVDGRLLFRPGGHGSLLMNLSQLSRDGDRLVFVKNIDNVAPESRHGELARWKRSLAGHLLRLRRRTFDLLTKLEAGSADRSLLSEALGFLGQEFAIEIPQDALASTDQALAIRLRARLDRPLRVCGVVLNRGEPGGGPFWVRRQDGSIDGQIVEGSQIDMADPAQREIWASSSHFNPVDVVCSLHDRAGNPYNLSQFVDPSTYFVAEKRLDGQQIRVLERPGLWNGSMADWNTAFVEVPEQTFSPVKTLFDLLRPAHQS